MRLDVYLAKKRNGLTRSKAQRAIKMGFVSVNDKAITKPAYIVKDDDKIIIVNKVLAKKPAGYFKLKSVQEKIDLIQPKDIVLDLGSSAGGYLLFASEIAKKVYGVEFSKKFEPTLRKIEREHSNMKIVFGDLFKMWPTELTGGVPVDLILNDLTLDWNSSIKAMHNSFNILKANGKILMTVKQASKAPPGVVEQINEALAPYELVIKDKLKLANQKDEFYVIIERK